MKSGAYVPLSVNYSEDDRVLDAGPVAELLWVRCLALAGRLWQQDGFLTARQVTRLLGDLDEALRAHEPLMALVRVGLLRPDDTDPHRPGYHLRSWSTWNRTAEEIVARDEAKRAADAKRQADLRARRRAEKALTDQSRRDGDVTEDVTVTPSRTAVQQQQQCSSASEAAAAATPPPLPVVDDHHREQLAALAKAISAAGLVVSWKLDAKDLDRLLAVIDRCGIKALVDHAKRRHRPDDPAFSVKAWLEGWEQLPALRLVNAKPKPCPRHKTPDRDHCSGCAADAKAAQ